MADPKQAIQDWYSEQLRKYYARRYRAYVRGKEKDDQSNELGRSAAFVPRKEHRGLPGEVRTAHAFYWKHFEETDLGSARVWRFVVRKKTYYAVLVTTDGDDGFAEIYDETGALLGAARRYIEVVARGSRDWLRAQATHPWDLPPELDDAPRRTLWGQPVEGIHCGETCEHACTTEPPGACIEKAGHLAAEGSPHRCSRCDHTWGGTPKPPEQPAPAVEPWLAEVHDVDAEVYEEERLLVTHVTIVTDAGPVTVPVRDILQIDFAPRKGGGRRPKKSRARDVVTTADAELTGTIEGDAWEAQLLLGGTTTRLYAWMDRVVNRITLKDAAGAFGARREFRLRGRRDGLVFGTNPYTLDSCLATAAVHAGALRDGQPGVVRVEIVPSPAGFEGSTRNGVTSESWEEAHEEGAFRILNPTKG
jgi:hypothetical protein